MMVTRTIPTLRALRRPRYAINVTLDGCVGHEEGIADPEIHAHAADSLERADALLFGRVTYGMMEDAFRPPASDALPAWNRPFAEVIDRARKHVVSSTLTQVDWNAELVRGDLATAVRELKEQPGTEILTGGVTLPTALAALGLIDEYELVLLPRVAGHGPYLLAGLPAPLDLRLVDERRPSNDAVVRRYVPR